MIIKKKHFNNKVLFCRFFLSWVKQSGQKRVKIGRKYIAFTLVIKSIVPEAFKKIINDILRAKTEKISKDGILINAVNVIERL